MQHYTDQAKHKISGEKRETQATKIKFPKWAIIWCVSSNFLNVLTSAVVWALEIEEWYLFSGQAMVQGGEDFAGGCHATQEMDAGEQTGGSGDPGGLGDEIGAEKRKISKARVAPSFKIFGCGWPICAGQWFWTLYQWMWCLRMLGV
jgi:hypothetical protein